MIPVPSAECPHPSRKAEMSRGLTLPSTRLSGHKECSLLSDLVGFAPSIDAVQHCLGQGSERQAENQWSDIIGCLLVLNAGWLASKSRFPGLAVWGVCPGSRSSLPSPTCSFSKLASILENSGSPPWPPQLDSSHPEVRWGPDTTCFPSLKRRGQPVSILGKQVSAGSLPNQHLKLNSAQSTLTQASTPGF